MTVIGDDYARCGRGVPGPSSRRALANRGLGPKRWRRRPHSSAGWAAPRSAAISPVRRSPTGLPNRRWSSAATSCPPGHPRARRCSVRAIRATEESLACYAAAEALGAQRLVATTGGELAEAARRDGVPVIGLPAGLQPRAAVGYSSASRPSSSPGAGRPPDQHRDRCRRIPLGRFRGSQVARSELAAEIGDAAPVIFGSDVTSPVAYRWKTQVNENTKSPAYSAALWRRTTTSSRAGRAPTAVRRGLPADRDQHPRERKRLELTAKAIEPYAAAVSGSRPRARLAQSASSTR